jgi:hypothetical protein
MLDPEELSKLRFQMTAVPAVGGQPGDYEEKWIQWFLERSFFRDFVYRNPPKKKGQELADAVVLFGDVIRTGSAWSSSRMTPVHTLRPLWCQRFSLLPSLFMCSP